MILFLIAAQGMTAPHISPPPPVLVTVGTPGPAINGVPVVRLVTPPQPRAEAQSYFSPAAAIGSGAHGRVSVMLGLDTQGRITDCHILQSSGSSALDMATCNILHRRARFTPAMDKNGNPVASYIGQHVDWPSR